MTSPRITLAVLAFNQSAYISEAVCSALRQSCERVEILLSDDASSDDTFDKMSALANNYGGPHDVVLRRSERNLGIGAHYNDIVRAARGELIVTMAGDDISLLDRVQCIASEWDASGERLDLLASHLIDMTQDGQNVGTLRVDDLAHWAGAADWVRQRPHVVGAGHAFTKRLFHRFGPLHEDVAYEDQVITFRALLTGGAHTLDAALVRYRRGGTSMRPSAAQGQRARLMTQSRRHLAEARQLLCDAETAGVTDIVGDALAEEIHRLQYFDDLLNAQDSQERWRVFFSAREVPLAWRWRKYWTSTMASRRDGSFE
ncbi:MAG: glycosyltransferase family 2 protein [Rhizobacter sp.]|nr:glycosyltransferase family 2 protein [Rhizobacter sp.]